MVGRLRILVVPLTHSRVTSVLLVIRIVVVDILCLADYSVVVAIETVRICSLPQQSLDHREQAETARILQRSDPSDDLALLLVRQDRGVLCLGLEALIYFNVVKEAYQAVKQGIVANVDG